MKSVSTLCIKATILACAVSFLNVSASFCQFESEKIKNQIRAIEPSPSLAAFPYTGNAALREWSIGPRYIGMVSKPRDFSSYYHAPLPEKVYWLTKPGKTKCVAVIGMFKIPVLNPLNQFNYGPIPDLQDMTRVQANILWGHSVSGTKALKGQKTFSLVSGNNEQFFLDCLFKSDKLEKYRIRNNKIGSTDWIPTAIPHPTLPENSPVPDNT